MLGHHLALQRICIQHIYHNVLFLLSIYWAILYVWLITGLSCLSWIFWEHENLSSLSVIWLINIKLCKEKEKIILAKNPGYVGIQLNHCAA